MARMFVLVRNGRSLFWIAATADTRTGDNAAKRSNTTVTVPEKLGCPLRKVCHSRRTHDVGLDVE